MAGRCDLVHDARGLATPWQKPSMHGCDTTGSTAVPIGCAGSDTWDDLPPLWPSPGGCETNGCETDFQGDQLAFDDFSRPAIPEFMLPVKLLPAVTPAAAPCRGLPGAPRESARPPLLDALMKHDLEKVHEALIDDPDSAGFPFWDHNVEPPLCAAVRLGCPKEIVELLLTSGADPNATDTQGRVPLDFVPAGDADGIQEVLTQHGATLDLRIGSNNELLPVLPAWQWQADPIFVDVDGLFE